LLARRRRCRRRRRRLLLVAAPRRESAWITRSPSGPFDSSFRIASRWMRDPDCWNYENAPCAHRMSKAWELLCDMISSSLESLAATVAEIVGICSSQRRVRSIIGSMGFAKRVAIFRP
jgi:hypothetical protein